MSFLIAALIAFSAPCFAQIFGGSSGGGGLSTVSTNGSLGGNGTSGSPLGVVSVPQTSGGLGVSISTIGAGGLIFGTNGSVSTGTISGSSNVSITTNATSAGITVGVTGQISLTNGGLGVNLSTPGAGGVILGSNVALSTGYITGTSGIVITTGTNDARLLVALSSPVASGTCGDTTHSCGLTWDANGRLSASPTNNAISAIAAAAGWTESGSPAHTVTTDIVGMGVSPPDGAASVVMQSTAATSNKLLSFRNSAGTEFGFINNVGDTNGYSTMSVLLRGEGVNSASSGHTIMDLQFANLQSGSLGVINTALRLETGGSGSTSNNISGDASKNFWFRVDNQNHSGGSGAYTEFLNVNAMGNVGIGTARAVSALHISSSPFRFCNGGTCYNDTNMSLLVDGDAATSFQIGISSLVITSTGATFGIPVVTQSSVTIANGALWIGQSPVTVTGSSVTLSATTPLLASSATFAGVFLSSSPTGAAGALVTATCPANTYVLSGGCNCSGGIGGATGMINAPGTVAPGGAAGTTWQCQMPEITTGATCTPYVICSRLQ